MYDPGTTTFMIMSCALVLMMGPALALFYGGLSRRKNVVNTMLMCVMAMGVVGCLWAILGDSIAYGGPDAFDEEGNLVNAAALFVGGFDRVFSSWSLTEMIDELAAVPEDATYADVAVGTYPGLVDVAFQAAFAMVTAAIVTGSLAGRMKFGALTFILVVWSMVVYAPMAHMVWGSGLIGNENAIGAIDFAGGTAVHICSGLGGLVLALILGKRMGFEVRVVRPHNVPAVMLGCGLLFVGWFGFNGGSALAADGYAALAICNTLLAGCSASASWLVVERIATGKPTLVGGCTGILAGLVVITPACGFVDPMIAIVMGIIVSPICYFFIAVLKRKLGWDDALDAFGCHGVGGIVGCILTGIFALPSLSFNGLGGLLYTGDPTLLVNQCLSVLVTVAYVGIATAIIGFAAKALFGGSLRVAKDEETRGLDTTVHGESGYPSFTGLDQ